MKDKTKGKRYSFLRMNLRLLPLTIRGLPVNGWLFVLICAGHSIFWALGTVVMQRFFDTISLAIAGRVAFGIAFLWLGYVFLTSVLQQLLNGLTNFWAGACWQRAESVFRQELHKKAGRLDAMYFENAENLDRIRKSEEGVAAATSVSMTMLSSVAFYSPYFLFMTVYLYLLQPILALSVVIIFVPSLASWYVRSVKFANFEEAAAPLRRHYEYAEKTIGDREFFKETRILGAFAFFNHMYRNALQLLNRENWKTESRVNLWELGMQALTWLGFTGVLALLVRALLLGDISAGAFAAVFNSLSLMIMIMDELVRRNMGEISSKLGALKNFFDFLDAPERTGDVRVRDAKRGVVFEKASFRYPGAEKDSLRSVDLCIREGETIAIVGENGAGKTTLVRLLTGSYLPTEGSVKLQGVETREIAPDALFAGTSAVMQKFQRYRLTLSQNISISDAEAPDRERMRESLEKADIPVEEFTGGLDTMLSREFDGIDLSGGQWQRVAIARGLYRPHSLIVLDEPTAAIDPLEETRVYRKFAELSQGATAVIVTHRLGSARIADRIVVMDGGRIDAIGTHEELMRMEGLYARMFHAQAECYGEA